MTHVHLRLVKGSVNTTPLLIKWRDDFLNIKRSKAPKTYQMYELVAQQLTVTVNFLPRITRIGTDIRKKSVKIGVICGKFTPFTV